MAGTSFRAPGVRAQAEWVVAHEALSRLAKERAAADAEEGRWLLVALRAAAHVHLGFGSFAEYVERLFGYKARSTQEKLRVAEALEGLPGIARALEAGALSWSCARELSRVAVAETEDEWLEVARGKTVHQVEVLVAGKSLGDEPSAAGDVAALRHVLRFEVTTETLALFREAMNALRRRSGSRLDDDAALLLLAREVLGGPGDDGRASYQVALSVCPECGQGKQRASGELVPVAAEVVAMAQCDGQHLGMLDVLVANEVVGAGEDARAAASESGRAREARSGGGSSGRAREARSGGGSSGRAREARGGGESSDGSAGAHTGGRGVEKKRRDAGAHTGGRAKQRIAPALRRAVLRRDGHCCAVPGCRNAVFLDLHHIELSSEGGGNGADNLVTLCGAHHRAAHRGELRVVGRVSTGVRFRHADGSDYGKLANPHRADTRAKAFVALRGLGFRERDVRRVLDESEASADGGESSLERVLREALAILTARCVSA